MKIVDVHVPCSAGSLKRAHTIEKPGKYRLSRRDCELYSVMIAQAGAWIRFRVMTGVQREVFSMPSTFTGSFWLCAGLEEGLIVEAHCDNPEEPMSIMVSFREIDANDV